MSIEAQIAAAELAAANAPEHLPVERTQGGQSLATTNAAPINMDVSSFLNAGGLQPDHWLEVKEAGMKIDKDEKAFLDDFIATIDFGSVKLFSGLRADCGASYEYIKTYALLQNT